MVHITVIAMTRNTIVVECYDLKVVHEESDRKIFQMSILMSVFNYMIQEPKNTV